MRRCPFHECRAQVPENAWACQQHWHRLTPDQKRTIWAAYDDYQTSRITIGKLRQVQQGVLDAVQKRDLFSRTDQ